MVFGLLNAVFSFIFGYEFNVAIAKWVSFLVDAQFTCDDISELWEMNVKFLKSDAGVKVLHENIRIVVGKLRFCQDRWYPNEFLSDLSMVELQKCLLHILLRFKSNEGEIFIFLFYVVVRMMNVYNIIVEKMSIYLLCR